MDGEVWFEYVCGAEIQFRYALGPLFTSERKVENSRSMRISCIVFKMHCSCNLQWVSMRAANSDCIGVQEHKSPLAVGT